jgi:hypothetical protein
MVEETWVLGTLDGLGDSGGYGTHQSGFAARGLTVKTQKRIAVQVVNITWHVNRATQSTVVRHSHIGTSRPRRTNCTHCRVPETVSHILLSCLAYRAHRLQLITRVGTVTLRSLVASKVDAAPVLAFARDTGRLPLYAS